MWRSKKAKRKSDDFSGRIKVLSAVLILTGFFIVARLFFLQVVEYPFYEALASGQHEILEQLFPKRGEIFARTENGLYPLAVNRDSYIVYAVPEEIDDPKKTAEVLFPWLQELKSRGQEKNEEEIVDLTENIATESPEGEEPDEDPDKIALEQILEKPDDPYEPLIKGVTKEDIKILEAYNLKGVYWVGQASRYYPEKNISSHILGFFSFLSDEKKGQYGLEGYFDEVLRGREGISRGEKDAFGSWISIAPRTLRQAKDGSSLVLTIDPAIQYIACTKLKEYVEKFAAEGGSVVILDPSSGKVIALCGYPDYDPNIYNKVESIDVFANPAITFAYEPGSVMKPITMAAGLDAAVVEADSTYFDEGEVKIAGFTIRNSDLKSHDTQTMANILEKSLNTGAIYVAEQLGTDLFKKYFNNFGFGRYTGIELSGEALGNITSLDEKGFIYTATASYGQGITATPLQMAAAYLPIVNGGLMYKIKIIDEIIYPDGENQIVEPEVLDRVISAQTSAIVSGMLVSVIKNGHAHKAGVKGYLLGGKTGTANIAGPGGKYLAHETNHTFVGFGPVDNPKFVMLTKLDKPQVNYAADSAAPLFGEIADFILKYYHIQPTEIK